MNNDEIPTPEFREEDVDRLIASYGKKPDPETRRKLQALLERELEVRRARDGWMKRAITGFYTLGYEKDPLQLRSADSKRHP